MATQAVVTIGHAAGNLDLVGNAYAADVGLSDAWLNTGAEQVFINNGSGAPITVTEGYGLGGTIDGQTLPAKTKTIAAGKSAVLGPYPGSLYNDANGKMNLTWSSATTVKFMPFIKGA